MSRLIPGVPAPAFTAPSPVNPRFVFHSLGGRYLLMGFLPLPGPERDAVLKVIAANQKLFNDGKRVFLGILPDAESYAQASNTATTVWFDDSAGEIRALFDAAGPQGELIPQLALIDPTLRYMGATPLDQAGALVAKLGQMGDPDDHAGVPMHAPVLIVPRVFEPTFCRQLIELYDRIGGQPSGVMRTIDGKTVGVLDPMKSRRDVMIEDEALQTQIRVRVQRRLAPEIEKAFQFKPTRIERYIVARYAAEEGGYFRRHRDNTTPGTKHRKFAVSINLNAEEFEGGDLCFPEFGSRTYRPPTGGAVVFSCSLLHEATPVTRGLRYACLPFLYDDAAAEIRRANAHTIVHEYGEEFAEGA